MGEEERGGNRGGVTAVRGEDGGGDQQVGWNVQRVVVDAILSTASLRRQRHNHFVRQVVVRVSADK